MVVLFLEILSKASYTICSLLASKALVASSNNNILVFFTTARAMATLYF